VGLTNAVLRAAVRRREELTAALEHDLEACSAHPYWLLQRLQDDWPDDWPAIVAANNARPPLTLRVNAHHCDRESYRERLTAVGRIAEPVSIPYPHPAPPEAEKSYVETALVLNAAVEPAALPGFAEGWISVQDAAAQLAAPLLDIQPGLRVLDACAAPGGKTGHLLECAPRLDLTALDQDAARLEHVAENLRRLRFQARLVVGDALRPADWWDGVPYDRILLDAPCSATGVIRRHPDIKLLRRDSDIAVLAFRQQALLASLWPLLRPQGRLLYATCSLLRQENEQVVESFLMAQPDAKEQPIIAPWGRPCSHGRQILPGEAHMDGFYYAVLVKRQVSREAACRPDS
jgi:16S rRNA (cytosine967-C5)-methyltransferase